MIDYKEICPFCKRLPRARQHRSPVKRTVFHHAVRDAAFGQRADNRIMLIAGHCRPCGFLRERVDGLIERMGGIHGKHNLFRRFQPEQPRSQFAAFINQFARAQCRAMPGTAVTARLLHGSLHGPVDFPGLLQRSCCIVKINHAPSLLSGISSNS